MRKREKQYTWEIRRLKESPVGLVDASDEASAIELAIKQYEIRRENRKRLIAVRYQ